MMVTQSLQIPTTLLLLQLTNQQNSFPLVTPATMPPTKIVVNQNHLSNIQCKIYFQPNNTYSYWSQKCSCLMSKHNKMSHMMPMWQLPKYHFCSLKCIRKNRGWKKGIITADWISEATNSACQRKTWRGGVIQQRKYDDIKQDLWEAWQNAKLLEMQVMNINTNHPCTIFNYSIQWKQLHIPFWFLVISHSSLIHYGMQCDGDIVIHNWQLYCTYYYLTTLTGNKGGNHRSFYKLLLFVILLLADSIAKLW